jgi:propanol-preferring alcohol dehydrogenase
MHHGIGQDGFYAEYVGIDVRGAVPLPDGMDKPPLDLLYATVDSRITKKSNLCLGVPHSVGATAYHGIVRRAQVQRAETVFLFGLGGLGFNALQIVHSHIGARVLVSDLRPEKLDAVRALGIPEADIVPPGTSIPDFIAEHGVHIDTVVEFVGAAQTFADAQRIVRPGGKITVYWDRGAGEQDGYEEWDSEEVGVCVFVWRAV